MRISDIPGDRALDVLADCIDAISGIASDETLVARLRSEDMSSPAGQLKAVSAVLKGHKGDVYAILAAIEGTTVAEYQAGHSALEVLADARDVLTDEDLLGFTSAARPGTGSRGDASASTGDHEA